MWHALFPSQQRSLPSNLTRFFRYAVFVCLGASFLSLSGCSGERLGIKMQFADAALLAKVKHVDIAIYPKSKVDCNQLNATNYSSTGPFAKDLIGEFPIKIESEEKRAIVDSLPEGTDLTMYFLALEVVDNNKKAIAQGCVSGITLKKGEIIPVEVTLNALP